MTISNTSQVRKSQTGEPTTNGGHFGSHDHSNPESALEGAGKTPSHNIYDYSGVGNRTVDRFPQNVTQARAALSNVRGEKDGGIRAVFLDSYSLPDEAEVRGPADGRPLLLVVSSGFGRLNVTSGKVIIRSDSRSGNVVYASGNAEVTILPGLSKKLSTDASEHAKVTIVPEDGDWGSQTVYGGDASITIVDNDTTHELRLLN